MEPEICFLQTNLAKIQPHDLVYDPFCGSGSNLISAAHFGAYVMGSDLDYNILYSRGKSSKSGAGLRDSKVTLRSEMTDNYKTGDQLLGTFRTDFSNTALRTSDREGFLDAIISDPPYGVREVCKKVGKNIAEDEARDARIERRKEKKAQKRNWAEEITKKPDYVENPNNKPDYMDIRLHYPQKVEYNMGGLFTDLVNFAAKTLRVGGRLAFWLPVSLDEMVKEDHRISHEDLEFVSKSIEALSGKTGRQLWVFEKSRPWSGDSCRFDSDFYKTSSNFRDLHMSTGLQ